MNPQGNLGHTRLEAGRVRASFFDQDQSVSAWTQQNPDSARREPHPRVTSRTPTLAARTLPK